MFFDSHADSAGLPPMNSPSLSSFYHHPNLNEYQDLGYPEPTFSNQTDVFSFEESFPLKLQSLFSTPPPYCQSSSSSPRLSNGSSESMEFAPPFSQMALPDSSGCDMPSSLLPPIGAGQFTQLGNEMSYMEPQNSMPNLHLLIPPGYFFSDNTEVPLLDIPEVWPTQHATTPEPKSKRKATASKRVAPLPASSSTTYSIASSPSSKTDHTPRAKKTGRSSHLILTNTPVSVTQGGYARKYACTWEGCGKAFTTSGHLVRHKRIHTGEKRYKCAMESCTSRFSRQDNMLQHYRTHFSSKSRRNPPVSSVENPKSSPVPDSSTTSNTSLVVPQLSNFGQFFVGQTSF
ncbi:hypothetical protein PTTG_27435 [Puccinia triticina 1-1 BBBD Race 1]|uniref:C2H2-type domain-containing protein n=2 Tax=Puccinia triticina TaxID=208348 RepID=A0A180GJZ8_PUCT1|nr:uncharacterized protein PtA15_1A836 [Puccinia triticina]OAV92980.1 hypothetical protein PTTG_27435 [Puccinia triticina 1-1 BBBD Race 1]WAQ81494.1 hypothetical protein PtA15_1A836 [Puccinia triticina]WAR52374.1 hypothetical protein PtB15_1B815 [Puccinia triticina]